MKTEFFYKRIGRLLLYACVAVIVLGSLFLANYLRRADSFTVGGNFYFLLNTSTHVQASVPLTQLKGGAGYLVKSEGKVAYAVYMQKEEALKAQESLLLLGERATVQEKLTERLYLKSRADKDKKDLYKGAFESLQGCIQVLSGEVKRLNDGATQQSTKRTLNTLSKQTKYMGEIYKNSFPACATLCNDWAERLDGAAEQEIVYVWRLRYILCEACESYVQLTKAFCL